MVSLTRYACLTPSSSLQWSHTGPRIFEMYIDTKSRFVNCAGFLGAYDLRRFLLPFRWLKLGPSERLNSCHRPIPPSFYGEQSYSLGRTSGSSNSKLSSKSFAELMNCSARASRAQTGPPGDRQRVHGEKVLRGARRECWLLPRQVPSDVIH